MQQPDVARATPATSFACTTCGEAGAGWTNTRNQKVGDTVARLEGDFAEITAICHADASCRSICSPGGVLGACTAALMRGSVGVVWHPSVDQTSLSSAPGQHSFPGIAFAEKEPIWA